MSTNTLTQNYTEKITRFNVISTFIYCKSKLYDYSYRDTNLEITCNSFRDKISYYSIYESIFS